MWTTDPRHIKTILAADFDGYVKGERQGYAFETVLGQGIFNKFKQVILGLSRSSGIFNTDGDTWKLVSPPPFINFLTIIHINRFHRGITKPYFHKNRFSDFVLFAKHGNHVVNLIKERLREGVAVDFQLGFQNFLC